MKVYVVNKLSEVDVTYNSCHGVFTNKKDAQEKAEKVLEDAKNYISNWKKVSELCIQNDDYMITIEIEEVDMPGDWIDRDKYVATILWTNEDIAGALQEHGIEPTEKNIKLVSMYGQKIVNNSIPSGWDAIDYIIEHIIDTKFDNKMIG